MRAGQRDAMRNITLRVSHANDGFVELNQQLPLIAVDTRLEKALRDGGVEKCSCEKCSSLRVPTVTRLEIFPKAKQIITPGSCALAASFQPSA